jgi:hypothetical protein
LSCCTSAKHSNSCERAHAAKQTENRKSKHTFLKLRTQTASGIGFPEAATTPDLRGDARIEGAGDGYAIDMVARELV